MQIPSGSAHSYVGSVQGSTRSFSNSQARASTSEQLLKTNHVSQRLNNAATPFDKQSEQEKIAFLAEKFDIQITPSEQEGFQYKIFADHLPQAFRFKNITDLEFALNNGFLRRKAKVFGYLKRVITGRDVHNCIEPLIKKAQQGEGAIVIDGGDDIAVSLENTGLSRQVVLSLQAGILYPAFMAVVYIGWKGANEEREQASEEYKALLQTRATLRQDILEQLSKAMANEAALKTALIDKRAQDKEALNLTQELLSSARFKVQILEKVNKLTVHAASKDTKEIQAQIKTAHEVLSALVQHNGESRQASLFAQEGIFSCSDKTFDPASASCQEFVMKLADYQDNLDSQFSRFCDAFIAAPFTESGLSGMFWGMAAYEMRALAELIAPNSATGATQVLGQIGDYFSVIGQAQMVLAGLAKLGLSIHEAKSTTDWLKEIKQTKLLDAPNLAKVKHTLEHFNKLSRTTQIVEGVGSSMLTLGQLGMILGGGMALALSPVLFAGVGLTVGGVVVSQAAAQFAGRVLTVNEEKTKAEEQIAKLIDPSLSVMENIEQRIQKLYDLSKENAVSKVWSDIYLYLLRNPKRSALDIFTHFSQKYQKYADDKGHYRHLYLSAVEEIRKDSQSAIALIHQAKTLLNEKKHTAFAAQIANHIQSLQKNQKHVHLADEDNVFVAIEHLFSFATQQGFLNDLLRRMTKRWINTNGYPLLKEKTPKNNPYIIPIETLKNKRPWKIINPLAVFTSLGKLGIHGVKYLKNRHEVNEDSQESESKAKGKSRWGRKASIIYAFDLDAFKSELAKAKQNPNSQQANAFREICQSLFNERLASGFLDGFGRDKRDVFAESLRHIHHQLKRDEVLRPVIYGISEQIKLANALEELVQVKDKFNPLYQKPALIQSLGFKRQNRSFSPNVNQLPAMRGFIHAAFEAKRPIALPQKVAQCLSDFTSLSQSEKTHLPLLIKAKTLLVDGKENHSQLAKNQDFHFLTAHDLSYLCHVNKLQQLDDEDIHRLLLGLNNSLKRCEKPSEAKAIKLIAAFLWQTRLSLQAEASPSLRLARILSNGQDLMLSQSVRLQYAGLFALSAEEINGLDFTSLKNEYLTDANSLYFLSSNQLRAFIRRIRVECKRLDYNSALYSAELKGLLNFIERLGKNLSLSAQGVLDNYQASADRENLNGIRKVMRAIRALGLSPALTDINDFGAESIALFGATELMQLEPSQISSLDHHQAMALAFSVDALSQSIKKYHYEQSVVAQKLKEVLRALKERVKAELAFVHLPEVQRCVQCASSLITNTQQRLLGFVEETATPLFDFGVQQEKISPSVFFKTAFSKQSAKDIACLDLKAMLSNEQSMLSLFNRFDINEIVNCQDTSKMRAWVHVLKYLHHQSENTQLQLAIEKQVAILTHQWLHMKKQQDPHFRAEWFSRYLSSIATVGLARKQIGTFRLLKLSLLSLAEIAKLSLADLQRCDLREFSTLNSNKARAYANALWQQLQTAPKQALISNSWQCSLYQKLSYLYHQWAIPQRLTGAQHSAKQAAISTIESAISACEQSFFHQQALAHAGYREEHRLRFER